MLVVKDYTITTNLIWYLFWIFENIYQLLSTWDNHFQPSFIEVGYSEDQEGMQRSQSCSEEIKEERKEENKKNLKDIKYIIKLTNIPNIKYIKYTSDVSKLPFI